MLKKLLKKLFRKRRKVNSSPVRRLIGSELTISYKGNSPLIIPCELCHIVEECYKYHKLKYSFKVCDIGDEEAIKLIERCRYRDGLSHIEFINKQN